MAKRNDKKFKLLERHEKLTPEAKNMVAQKIKRLRKELDFAEKLLKKPTIDRDMARSLAKKKRREL